MMKRKLKGQASTEYLLLVGLGIALVIGGVVLANTLLATSSTISSQITDQQDKSLASLRSPCVYIDPSNPNKIYDFSFETGNALASGSGLWSGPLSTDGTPLVIPDSSQAFVGVYSMKIPKTVTATLSSTAIPSGKKVSLYYKTSSGSKLQIACNGQFNPNTAGTGGWVQYAPTACTSFTIKAVDDDVYVDNYCFS